MAKLTAHFDMQDKITSKLKKIRGEMKVVERYLDKLNRPTVLDVKDKATKKLRSIKKLQQDLSKNSTITMTVTDAATRSLKKINSYLRVKMPKTYELTTKLRDRATPMLSKLRRYLHGKIIGAHMLEIMARDRATPVIHKIANYARRSLAKGYNFTVTAIDRAMKTVGRIASYARSAIPKYRDFTIRAIDRTARVIGGVKRALFSIPSVITVALAVVGAGKIKDATVGAAMKFEGYEVAMDHWLKGDKKASQELVTWMGQFADKTPFSSPDLFPALTRGIGISGGDVNMAKKLLELSANMAALTPGAAPVDAMEALADAQMGEFERMKAFNMKITKESFKAGGGWAGFVKNVDATFGGGAQKLAETSEGIIATLQGYKGSLLRSAGAGFLEPMKPRLTAISNWLDNNQDKWGQWKETVRKAGEDASEWVFSRLEKGFSYIRTNYLENGSFKKLDFEGKVKFIMDDLGTWWDNSGRDILANISRDVGSAVFDGVVWGIKEGLKGIGGMWADAFKNPSVENFAGAGVATLLATSLASIVLAPLIKGLEAVFKGGKWAAGVGKKAGGLFGKAKNKFGGKGGGGKGAGTYTYPFTNKGQPVQLNTPNQHKNTGRFGWLKKAGRGLGATAKRVPVLGSVIGAGTILAASKGQRGEAAGNVGGGLAGAAVGASIGSAIPGIGTAIGGIVGGIVGSFAGSAAGSWVSENWDTIKGKASEAGEAIKNTFVGVKDGLGSTLFSGEWWGGKWESVKSWTSDKWSNAKELWDSAKESLSSTLFSGDWWSEKWHSVMDVATSTVFSFNWWAEQAGKVYGFLEGTLFNGEWWSEKWGAVVEWGAEKWESAVTVWNGVLESISSTIFNPEWWGQKWESVKGWAQEKWDSAITVWTSITDKITETLFNPEWWANSWVSVVTWAQEKWDTAQVVWDSVTSKIAETIFNAEWWSGKWDNVTAWTQTKWDEAKSIWNSVRETISSTLFSQEWWSGKWGQVADWASGALGKIKEWGSGVVESFQSGRQKGNRAAEKYANGGMINRPHLGLVGEAGPEMIIPLSSGRRSRAMQLYEQTGQMLGIRAYANGGLAGGTPKAAAPVNASVKISGISVSGNDKDGQRYGEAFATSIAGGINGKVVSLDQWRQRNIDQPLTGVVKGAAGFGTNTVLSFAAGQNATATGTRPYLATHVHRPFDETRAKGQGWGSGTASEFSAGLMSQSGQVQAAAKHLAGMVEKTFRQELGIHSPSRVMAQLGEFASLGIVKGLGNVDIKTFAEKQAGSLAAAFSGMGNIGGNISEWIKAAMMITGVPSSWLGPLSVIAQKESGGNPRAQNNWDINAKRGIPSKGLMQTIGPTFNAYKGAGLNDIFNPIHNAVAAINYIKSRYGNVFNVPGIKSMAAGGAYRGYWTGTNGPLRSGETAWVGERGPELVNLPRGSEVLSHSESKRVARNQVAAAVGGSRSAGGGRSGIRDLVLQFTGDNHFGTAEDRDAFIEKVKQAILQILRDEYNEGGDMAVYD